MLEHSEPSAAANKKDEKIECSQLQWQMNSL